MPIHACSPYNLYLTSHAAAFCLSWKNLRHTQPHFPFTSQGNLFSFVFVVIIYSLYGNKGFVTEVLGTLLQLTLTEEKMTCNRAAASSYVGACACLK